MLVQTAGRRCVRTGSKFSPRWTRWGRAELARRWEQAQRLIRENGVTYNVHGDAAGQGSPVGTRRHSALAPGRRMGGAGGRADAAGAAAESHSGGYLRTAERCAARRPSAAASWSSPTRVSCGLVIASRFRRDTYLHLYAAHLARSADSGGWLVLSDRTQTPSGRRLCRREPDRHLADAAE